MDSLVVCQFVAIAILLPACAGPLPTRYRIVQSPVFSDDNVQAIALAAQAWEQATKGEAMLDVGDVALACDGSPTCIYVHPATRSLGGLVAFSQHSPDGSIDVSLAPTANLDMAQAFAHELGHAMGSCSTGECNDSDHVTSGSSVMYAAPELAAQGPTEEDAMRWRAMR